MLSVDGETQTIDIDVVIVERWVMTKMYSLGAVMRYLEKEFGHVLEPVEQAALEDMLDDEQKEMDKIG